MNARHRLIRTDAQLDGTPLSKEDREAILRPYLPAPRTTKSIPQKSPTAAGRRQLSQTRSLFTLFIHKLIFYLIQTLISLYVRLRQIYHALHARIFSILYHHHRTPDLIRRDVRNLTRLPQHLSVIVDLTEQNSVEASQRLISEVAELATWCACIGVEKLSVYERTGALKIRIPQLHQATHDTLANYFPRHSLPDFHIRAPNKLAYSPSPSRTPSPNSPNTSSDDATRGNDPRRSIQILLLSASDGRDTLVDLTKTIAEMSQKGKVTPDDITIDLIQSEIEESTGFSDPDILVVMTGAAHSNRDPVRSRRQSKGKGKGNPEVLSGQVATTRETDANLGLERWSGHGICLMGYPPWQLRLTEIFQVQDSTGVDYQIFLRALHRYAKAEMRFGR